MEKVLRQKLPGGEFQDVSPVRSRVMSTIRGKDNLTTERRLRFALVRAGIAGWKLHPREVCGHPDFYFPRDDLAVFTDGCFWHGCPKCGHVPSRRSTFWRTKLERNRLRDAGVNARLEAESVRVLRFWEHDLRDDLVGCVTAVREKLDRARSSERRRLIHSTILDVAGGISKPLFDAIRTVGPVSLQGRKDRDLRYFLARSIVGQQLSTMAAQSIWARVEAAALVTAIDIPQVFDEGCAARLRACGVSRNKIRALQALCAAERDGVLRDADLHHLGHEERSEQLRLIWGIGQWTCDMASIFHYRCPDVWPEGDVAVQRTFARLVGGREPSGVVPHFAPYRSYLALAMWKVRDTLPQQSK